MNEYSVLINLGVNSVLAFIATVYLRSYLSSYLSEKAKLKAQEEMIGKVTAVSEKARLQTQEEMIGRVTTEISRVEQVFKKEISLYDITLQKLSNNQLSHRVEERNAIVEFYFNYNQWYFSLLQVNFLAYNMSQVVVLSELIQNLSVHYGKTKVAESKVSLLVVDEEVVRKAGELTFQLLLFDLWMREVLSSLLRNLESNAYYHDKFMIAFKDIQTNRPEVKRLADKVREIESEREVLYGKYKSEFELSSRGLVELSDSFTSRAKSYLVGL